MRRVLNRVDVNHKGHVAPLQRHRHELAGNKRLCSWPYHCKSAADPVYVPLIALVFTKWLVQALTRLRPSKFDTLRYNLQAQASSAITHSSQLIIARCVIEFLSILRARGEQSHEWYQILNTLTTNAISLAILSCYLDYSRCNKATSFRQLCQNHRIRHRRECLFAKWESSRGNFKCAVLIERDYDMHINSVFNYLSTDYTWQAVRYKIYVRRLLLPNTLRENFNDILACQ